MPTLRASPAQGTSQDYDATEVRTMVLGPLTRLVNALDTSKGMDRNFEHARVVLPTPMINTAGRNRNSAALSPVWYPS
jgi:hypothetical protein